MIDDLMMMDDLYKHPTERYQIRSNAWKYCYNTSSKTSVQLFNLKLKVYWCACDLEAMGVLQHHALRLGLIFAHSLLFCFVKWCFTIHDIL